MQLVWVTGSGLVSTYGPPTLYGVQWWGSLHCGGAGDRPVLYAQFPPTTHPPSYIECLVGNVQMWQQGLVWDAWVGRVFAHKHLLTESHLAEACVRQLV